jgi:putative transposase
MDETTTTQSPSPLLGADWSDPLEDGVRGRVRAFIEAILEEELSAALGRSRCERSEAASHGWRNGRRDRQVIGTFGAGTILVPRARARAR